MNKWDQKYALQIHCYNKCLIICQLFGFRFFMGGYRIDLYVGLT